MNKKHVKMGFTLIELIIVLTIIAVLSAIIGVAWNNVITRTRVRTSNSAAKVIFNAAQTEAIRICQEERLDPAHGYMGTGDFYLYWNGHSGGFTKSGDSSSATSYKAGANKLETGKTNRLTGAINKIAGTEGCYKIWISNYTVKSVAYVPSSSSKYLGTYPKQQEHRSAGADPRSLHTTMADID